MFINTLYKKYGDRVQFLLVYIREAHPKDGWQKKGSSTVRDPKTLENRQAVGLQCTSSFNFQFPAVVDTMKDETNIQYAAWPERLYLIDPQGKIAYSGKQGPWGFTPTIAWENKSGKRDKGSQKGQSLEQALIDHLKNDRP